jgi:WD40 repeat protein
VPLPPAWDAAARSAISALAVGGIGIDPCPVTFSADGRVAARGSSIWDTTDGSTVQVDGQNAVVSPDGVNAVTGMNAASAKGLRVWNASTGDLVAAADHWLRVGGRYSPDGSRVVTVGRQDAVIADAHTLAELTTLAGRQAFSAVFNPDGSRVVTATFDGASVWDASTGDELLHVVGSGEVLDAALSPDGTLLATGSIGGSAMVFDATTGQELAKFPHYGDSDLWTIAFAPDGTSLILAGTTGLQVFDVSR